MGSNTTERGQSNTTLQKFCFPVMALLFMLVPGSHLPHWLSRRPLFNIQPTPLPANLYDSDGASPHTASHGRTTLAAVWTAAPSQAQPSARWWDICAVWHANVSTIKPGPGRRRRKEGLASSPNKSSKVKSIVLWLPSASVSCSFFFVLSDVGIFIHSIFFLCMQWQPCWC